MKIIPLNSMMAKKSAIDLQTGVDLSTVRWRDESGSHWHSDDVKALDLIKWYDYEMAESITIIGSNVHDISTRRAQQKPIWRRRRRLA